MMSIDIRQTLYEDGNMLPRIFGTIDMFLNIIKNLFYQFYFPITFKVSKFQFAAALSQKQ